MPWRTRAVSEVRGGTGEENVLEPSGSQQHFGGELRDPDPALLSGFGRDRPVRTDGNGAVAIVKGDRTTISQDLKAFGGDKIAVAIELEGAVACVALAVRRLHGEPAFSIDGHIQRISRLARRTRGQVLQRAGIDDEGHIPVGWQGVGRVGIRHQVFLEDLRGGLEAAGFEIRQIVGDDVHLAPQSDLPRQRYKYGVV